MTGPVIMVDVGLRDELQELADRMLANRDDPHVLLEALVDLHATAADPEAGAGMPAVRDELDAIEALTTRLVYAYPEQDDEAERALGRRIVNAIALLVTMEAEQLTNHLPAPPPRGRIH